MNTECAFVYMIDQTNIQPSYIFIRDLGKIITFVVLNRAVLQLIHQVFTDKPSHIVKVFS